MAWRARATAPSRSRVFPILDLRAGSYFRVRRAQRRHMDTSSMSRSPRRVSSARIARSKPAEDGFHRRPRARSRVLTYCPRRWTQPGHPQAASLSGIDQPLARHAAGLPADQRWTPSPPGCSASARAHQRLACRKTQFIVLSSTERQFQASTSSFVGGCSPWRRECGPSGTIQILHDGVYL